MTTGREISFGEEKRRVSHLFNIEKFLSSGPSSRGELLAYAARELSTVHSCPSSCGNVSVGSEEQSYWSLNTLISFVLGFFCRKHVDRCDSVVLSQAETDGVAPTRRGGGRMVD